MMTKTELSIAIRHCRRVTLQVVIAPGEYERVRSSKLVARNILARASTEHIYACWSSLDPTILVIGGVE